MDYMSILFMPIKLPTKASTKPDLPFEFDYHHPLLTEVNLIHHFFHEQLMKEFLIFPTNALETYKKAWSYKKIEERITASSDLFLVAWDNQLPIGLISGSPPEGGVGTIIWLMVDKNYRNKKIGSYLLSLAKQFYQNLGCHKIKLTAPTKRAKEFYLKQGMMLEGFHAKHWWKIDFWSLAQSI